MLSAVALVALIAGSSAQQLTPVQRGPDNCVGQTNQVPYQFCGSFGGNTNINIYWSYVAGPPAQTNILFEGTNDAWRAIGFAADGTMVGARAMIGCQDGFDPNNDLVDAFLAARNGAAVRGGLGLGNQSIMEITTVRENGLCGHRFERLAVPPNVPNVTQHVLMDAPNTIIAAQGANNNFGIHNAFTSAQIDLIQGMASGLGQVMPLMANQPGGDNSAGALQLSSAVVAAAASLLTALW